LQTAVAALVVALLANATANVLIRWGMKDLTLDMAEPLTTLKAILLNGRVLAGIVLFAANVLAYAYALSRLRLSVAYPVMTSVGLVIVMVLSFALLGEKITGLQLVGTAFILTGVVLVASQMG
jgi:multidrug transporter EmrE-like cation transporter